MIKLLGMMLIVTTSSLTGILLSYRLRERVETLRQLSAMLDEIILHIRWGASTVQEIIDNLCMNSAYSHLGFLPLLNSSKADFITRWNNAVDSWSDKRSITDIELLRSLANGLGESDTEGQLSWYMQKKAYVDAALSEAAEEYGKKARLYRTLGVVGVCYLSQFAYDICRDNGAEALATQAETIGKITVMLIAMPMFESVISIISRLVNM